MDNQNNQNNQQNGYTNFNNYQPNPAQTPQPQTYQAPPAGYQTPPTGYQQQGYQQQGYQQYPYQVPVQENANKGLALGIISIVLTALSCCCLYFTSVPAAILGLIGVIRNKKSIPSWIGLILAVLATIAWIGFTIYYIQLVQNDPDQLRQILTDAYGEDMANQLLQQMQGFIVSLFR